MKNSIIALLTVFTLLTLSCSNDDEVIPQNIEIQNFVWKGMNLYYFWQDEVPNLADDQFSSQNELNEFLTDYNDPANLFEDLKFNVGQEGGDKYSWIVDNYIELEEQLQGTSLNTGAEFGLVRLSGGNNIFGYVRYILPNSDASTKNIQRGDLFLEVDGQQLTLDNYRSLLFGENTSYTLGLAALLNNLIAVTGETVSLTKEIYTENPVFIAKTINEGGQKIGYVMYNGFVTNFEQELNASFSQFKSEGVTDLVLDLRYNGGGFGSTAVNLAGMITGQFQGQLFYKETWNPKWQEAFEQQSPQSLINNFTNTIANGSPINSLNLTKLYVLVTGSSASASELVINGLKPYIDVKLIGTKTEGKHVGSITLYDSDNFRKPANENHTYAMQPIVLQVVNKLEENNNNSGFDPDIVVAEDFGNLGVLGDENEPLLEAAINDILNITTVKQKKSLFTGLEEVGNSKQLLAPYNNLFVENDIDFQKLISTHANR